MSEMYTREQADRFWSKVTKGSVCWEWRAQTATNGYGRVKIGGVSKAAHRVAYELVKGPIPEGHELDHLCRNRACVNPAHLEPVSHRVNTLRGDTIVARAARKTHCPEGHPLSGDNLVPSSLKLGRRGCLACSREKARERRTQRQEEAA